MGEMADDIIDGIFCQVCGAVMEDVTEFSTVPGYARTCQACVDEDLAAQAMESRHWNKEGQIRKKNKKWADREGAR
jgi:hypothetical protein